MRFINEIYLLFKLLLMCTLDVQYFQIDTYVMNIKLAVIKGGCTFQYDTYKLIFNILGKFTGNVHGYILQRII